MNNSCKTEAISCVPDALALGTSFILPRISSDVNRFFHIPFKQFSFAYNLYLRYAENAPFIVRFHKLSSCFLVIKGDFMSSALGIILAVAFLIYFAYKGINVILFILMPLASDVFEKSGIPRTMLPGIGLPGTDQRPSSQQLPGTL